MIFPTVTLALLTITIGLGANYSFELAHETANQLLDKSQYIQKVLGSKSP